MHYSIYYHALFPIPFRGLIIYWQWILHALHRINLLEHCILFWKASGVSQFRDCRIENYSSRAINYSRHLADVASAGLRTYFLPCHDEKLIVRSLSSRFLAFSSLDIWNLLIFFNIYIKYIAEKININLIYNQEFYIIDKICI